MEQQERRRRDPNDGGKQRGCGGRESKTVEKSMPAEERKNKESRQDDRNLSEQSDGVSCWI